LLHRLPLAVITQMKKKHQHFIPKTYLKKFARTRDKGIFLLDAYDKINNEIKTDLSVRDVCVETDLYTLKYLKGKEKYKIENFFSDNIETHYPKVYNLLVKEKKEYITGKERAFILNTTLSMYFRTPKVLNKFVSFASKLIEQFQSSNEVEKINFLGFDISIKDKSFNQIKKEIKENQRIDFIKIQVALLTQFVKFKFFDGFAVIELVGDNEFITSDNPVIIRNSFSLKFNLFDTKNSIYIPLDSKHALFIAPKQSGTIINQVFYQKDDFVQHIALNQGVYDNAERWVLGSEKGILNFLNDLEEYAKPGNDNHPLISKFKNKIDIMNQLLELAEKGISNENIELIDLITKLKAENIFDENVELNQVYEDLKSTGLKI